MFDLCFLPTLFSKGITRLRGAALFGPCVDTLWSICWWVSYFHLFSDYVVLRKVDYPLRSQIIAIGKSTKPHVQRAAALAGLVFGFYHILRHYEEKQVHKMNNYADEYWKNRHLNWRHPTQMKYVLCISCFEDSINRPKYNNIVHKCFICFVFRLYHCKVTKHLAGQVFVGNIEVTAVAKRPFSILSKVFFSLLLFRCPSRRLDNYFTV